jgi:hypothetical protein
MVYDSWGGLLGRYGDMIPIHADLGSELNKEKALI